MAYSTPAMVRQALVPSGDGSLPATPSNTAADLADAQLVDAIAEADALIDGYIGGFYAVPADLAQDGTAPNPLGRWSRTIAAYLATCTYRGSQDFTNDDPVYRRYSDVLAALKDVSAGKLRLQLPENVSGNSAAGVGSAFNPYDGDLWTPDDFSLSTAPNPGINGTPFWWGFM